MPTFALFKAPIDSSHSVDSTVSRLEVDTSFGVELEPVLVSFGRFYDIFCHLFLTMRLFLVVRHIFVIFNFV